jgi:hypothetical protein
MKGTYLPSSSNNLSGLVNETNGRSNYSFLYEDGIGIPKEFRKDFDISNIGRCNIAPPSLQTETDNESHLKVWQHRTVLPSVLLSPKPLPSQAPQAPQFPTSPSQTLRPLQYTKPQAQTQPAQQQILLARTTTQPPVHYATSQPKHTSVTSSPPGLFSNYRVLPPPTIPVNMRGSHDSVARSPDGPQ